MNLFAPFNSDGYKLAHAAMYAEGTNKVYSNLTPRSDRLHKDPSVHYVDGLRIEIPARATSYYDGKLVFIGVQGAIMEIVENWDKFFGMDKAIAVARFKFLTDNYLGKDAVSVDNLCKLHDLGYLPLRIKTLDEGSKVPMGIPVLTVTNTVDHAYWLVNFLETTISNLTWKPSTVATIAAEYKRMLIDFAEKTGVDRGVVEFQAHSFACRGMSGPEDSARSEFGHVALFPASDSLGSILYAQEYYGAGDFVAGSVPATEHAVSTSNILRIEQELENGDYLFENPEQRDIHTQMLICGEDPRLIAEIMFMYELMLKFPNGILSYVADSFDFWGLISRGLPYMKHVIMRRETNGITPGRLVIRPDSGDPVKVVCGDRKADTSEERLGAVAVLAKIFGTTITEKGFLELDSHIGLIYGDSITPRRCYEILQGLAIKGFASSCCVFGVGSYTYQCNTRDVFGFAVKATYTEVYGKGVVIYKDPKTDSKKKSAKGLLYVGKDSNGEFFLLDNVTPVVEDTGCLITRFEDGVFYNQTTLGEIRGKVQHG